MAMMFPASSYSGRYARSAETSSSIVKPVTGSTLSGKVNSIPSAAACSAIRWMGDRSLGAQVRESSIEVQERTGRNDS